MALSFHVVLCLGMLALCLAGKREVRWCVKSDLEESKCRDLINTCKNSEISLSCVKKSNTKDCFDAIKDDIADAACVDGGDVHAGSLNPYNLKPIMSEDYGTAQESDTCYYAVAVVKKSSKFNLGEIKGLRSCHTGVGKTAGWNIPIGLLLEKNIMEWEGPESESIEKAVSKFFSSSCAPGASEPKLCQQCSGKGNKKCSRSPDEPYYNYNGALKCLQDDKGDVAFVKHTTVSPDLAKDYELLCPDNTRRAISEYKECNLGRVPAHAVITRNSGDKTQDIITLLTDYQSQDKCHLFSSKHGKDLMFKDSAVKLIPVPPNMDSFLYLGPDYYNAIQALKHEKSPVLDGKVRWCTQSKQERNKCDNWVTVSGGAIECTQSTSAEGCILQILKGEADAVTLDGGYMYTAGQCGLVPAMGEYYNIDDLSPCKRKGSQTQGTYYAVAVAKKSNPGISWPNLKGKKSCHTAVGRTAGWNIPVGLITNETKNCDIGAFFSQSCAPGADVNSNLCELCIGDARKTLGNTKCSASDKEAYYGYSGAFRCLVEAGDVAFVKHTTVFENTDGKNPAPWAKGLKSGDFELLCPDGTRAPVGDYKTCNLAQVPAHAIVCRSEKRNDVVKIVANQQSLFGRQGFEMDMFNLFKSENGKDLLFKDSTQCLLEVTKGTTMQKLLGNEYYSAVSSLNQCTKKSELLAACTFHSC
ncbi:serotransferrin [Ascaphus truei]|uniref:serotransferrin n=1 Tax=Ascaphus truei TaxID=8439 RepID=UPI003F5A42A7